jgi:hypothetical protein
MAKRAAAGPRPQRNPSSTAKGSIREDRRSGDERRSGDRRLPRGRERRVLRPSADVNLHVEAVFFYLHDVGRSIGLDEVAALVPAHPDLGIAKRRDTPASLTLPTPLILSLAAPEAGESFESLSAQAKIFEDGVVTIVVRARARLPMSQLFGLEDRQVAFQGRSVTVSDFAEEAFTSLFAALDGAVVEPRAIEDMDRESYLAFCLLECGENPVTFIQRNREYCAALLIGEDPATKLHESQVAATVGNPFSYRAGDLAVFELDRCIIIDPEGDYEDLLLIAEHANYQLLELRVLDKLLDAWLDEAEDDVGRMTKGGRRLSLRGGAATKVAHIQALRLDALFILENIENSSKIIGDYYLGQVYGRLCEIFNTEGWKWSVERRLDTLQDVYDMVKTDTDERKLRWLEIVIIVVCVVSPLIEILKLTLLAD